MKKLIALLLLMSMLACALASCGDTESSETHAETGPRREVEDGLPSDLNFGDRKVTVLSNDEEGTWLKRDAITNDVLNDAIYNREYKVNSRLGVNLNFILDADAETKASDSVLTGLDEYQILVETSGSMLTLASSGSLIDLKDDGLKYMDLDHKWYNQYLREKATIYDKLYCITGSLSLLSTSKCAVTAFSPSVLEQLGIEENMYDLVRSGKWTIGKELDMIKKAYSDTTGDGKTQDDAFGLCFDNSSALDYFWSAFDLSLISRTEDGGLAFSEDTTKFVAALDLVYSMMYENNAINCFDQDEYDQGGYGSYGPSIMSEKRALFVMSNLSVCSYDVMRNMDGGYGIIPLPKWDEEQTDYYTCLRDGYTFFGIPKTNTDLAVTSAVIEALSSESYASVATAYYDKILKGRYMNDIDSQQMLDIITNNINLDYALVHGFALDHFSAEAFRSILRAGKKNYSSFWRANKKKYTKALSDMLDKYASSED